MIGKRRPMVRHHCPDACPTYLTTTVADCQRLGTMSKILPPIREQLDQDELWRALHDGTIDIIATDDAPHEPTAKHGLSWVEAAGGMIGVQTMLPLLLAEVDRTAVAPRHRALD